MSRHDELTDEQWAQIEPLIPALPADLISSHVPPVADPPTGLRRRGRPRVHSDRAVMNGVLWVLRTGLPWERVPAPHPSGSTCFRRYAAWVKAGLPRKRLEAFALSLGPLVLPDHPPDKPPSGGGGGAASGGYRFSRIVTNDHLPDGPDAAPDAPGGLWQMRGALA